MDDFLDRLCSMTPMDILAESARDGSWRRPPRTPPKPPFTPPAGFRLVLRSYNAGHGDTRSHWVVEEA